MIVSGGIQLWIRVPCFHSPGSWSQNKANFLSTSFAFLAFDQTAAGPPFGNSCILMGNYTGDKLRVGGLQIVKQTPLSCCFILSSTRASRLCQFPYIPIHSHTLWVEKEISSLDSSPKSQHGGLQVQSFSPSPGVESFLSTICTWQG